MSRRGQVLLAAGAGFLAGLLVAGVLTALLLWPKNRVVARWDAPDGIYHAMIMNDGPDTTSLFGSVHRWELYLGQDAEVPGYGHFVSLPALPDLYGEDGGKWRESRVKWTSDGVRFTFWTGHELFVPARAYRGGR